jgi:hypothetical protein
MLEREYGRIINIASLSTFVALLEVAALFSEQGGRRVTDKVAGT